MPQFSTTRRVRHAAADMFDLVADIERYPEFVPMCRSLSVRKRIPEPEGVEVLIADMSVAYKLVRRGIREIKDAMYRDIRRSFHEAGIDVASGTYDIVGLPPIRIKDGLPEAERAD